MLPRAEWKQVEDPRRKPEPVGQRRRRGRRRDGGERGLRRLQLALRLARGLGELRPRRRDLRGCILHGLLEELAAVRDAAALGALLDHGLVGRRLGRLGVLEALRRGPLRLLVRGLGVGNPLRGVIERLLAGTERCLRGLPAHDQALGGGGEVEELADGHGEHQPGRQPAAVAVPGVADHEGGHADAGRHGEHEPRLRRAVSAARLDVHVGDGSPG